MDRNRFIKECNKSPIFKKGGLITSETLESCNFVKKNYNPSSDLMKLQKLLRYFPPEIVYDTKKYLPKDVRRDVQHHKLSDATHGQEEVIKIRRKLKMPFANRGFSFLEEERRYKKYKNVFLGKPNTSYDAWLLSISSLKPISNQYELSKMANAVEEKVHPIIEALRKKWKLAPRYHDAITELVLFNCIIPADAKITFTHDNFLMFKEDAKMSINFTPDITKKELIDFIDNDPLEIFNASRKLTSPSLKRQSAKESETQKMLSIYAQYKKDGKTNKYIFSALRIMPEFKHLTEHAIKKRIERNIN